MGNRIYDARSNRLGKYLSLHEAGQHQLKANHKVCMLALIYLSHPDHACNREGESWMNSNRSCASICRMRSSILNRGPFSIECAWVILSPRFCHCWARKISTVTRITKPSHSFFKNVTNRCCCHTIQKYSIQAALYPK